LKILYLTPCPPWPPNRGGNQRSNLLQRALDSVGSVDLFLLQNKKPTNEEGQILRSRFGIVGQHGITERGQRGAWKYIHSISPALVTKLAHNLGNHALHYRPITSIKREIDQLHAKNNYDIVVGRYLMPIALAGGLDLPIPAIVDVDDVDTQKYISRLDRPGVAAFERWMLQWHIARYNREVPRVASTARHLWVAADEDIAAIPHPSVSVLHNIPFIDETNPVILAPANPDSKIILSVTSMNFAVNERAIDRFVKNIWPQIKAREPDSTFVVVGSQMTKSQQSRWSAVDGVKALGFVEDLAAAYRDAAFTVVPIFEGGGTKIKVLESLIYGRASVVTEHSLRGYDHILNDAVSVMVAADEKLLVEKCVMLLRDPILRHAIASRGQELVAKNFSFESFRNRVVVDVRKVLESGCGSDKG